VTKLKKGGELPIPMGACDEAGDLCDLEYFIAPHCSLIHGSKIKQFIFLDFILMIRHF